MVKELLKRELRNRGLAESDISEILPHFHIKSFRKGEIYINMGDREFPPGYVLSGLFHDYIVRDDGRSFVYGFMGPGDFLGCSLRWGRTSPTFIECLKNGDVLTARFSDVAQVLGRTGFLNKLHHMTMDDCLEDVNKRLADLATMEAADRYRYYLKKYGSLADIIPLHCAASYLGITPTQLSRIRKQF